MHTVQKSGGTQVIMDSDWLILINKNKKTQLF